MVKIQILHKFHRKATRGVFSSGKLQLWKFSSSAYWSWDQTWKAASSVLFPGALTPKSRRARGVRSTQKPLICSTCQRVIKRRSHSTHFTWMAERFECISGIVRKTRKMYCIKWTHYLSVFVLLYQLIMGQNLQRSLDSVWSWSHWFKQAVEIYTSLLVVCLLPNIYDFNQLKIHCNI